MADPFTIRIFVPDGDPEGVRLIDRMNWTGLGIVFRRTDWQAVRNRPEFQRTGIYILVGYRQPDDELPTLYIGQADGVRGRIDQHITSKDFWDWGVAFISSGGGLNRAHVTWLEHALVARAHAAGRCFLDNGNAPQEPAMTEAEKADTQGFLKEVLQILPLVGLRAFEQPQPVSRPEMTSAENLTLARSSNLDTIIVPAQKDGFERVFLGESAWYAIRIAGGMLDRIKFIAAYQTAPVSAITHLAPVKQIEPYGETGKYKLVFSEPAQKITSIPFGDAPSGAMQGPRYTSIDRLRTAKSVAALLAK